MRFRTKLILQSGILLALVSTYLLGLVFSPERTGVRNNERPLTIGFDTGKIGRIVIRNNVPELTLVSSVDGWRIESDQISLPAIDSRITAFLRFFRSQKSLRTVTGNPEQWPRFMVDDLQASRISLYDTSGALLSETYIGRTSESGSTVYVRSGTEGTVYEASIALRSYIERDRSFWLELRVLPPPVKESTISSVSVESEIRFGSGLEEELVSEKYTLARITDSYSTVWKLAGKDMETDQRPVQEIVRNLAALEAVEYVTDEQADTGLRSPAAKILVGTDTANKYRILIGRRKGDSFYLTTEGSPYIYLVDERRLRRVLKPLRDLVLSRSS